MAEQGNQGNGSQGQESGAGNQGQGQESASQDQQGNQSGQQAQGQESGQGGQQGGEQAPDFSTMSEADLRTYAAKLYKDAGQTRTEAARYRTQLQETTGKLTEAERAQMTEQERREADLTAAQAQVQEKDSRITELERTVEDLTKGAAIREALAQAGAINPQTAQKVGDWGAVKLKEDGSLDQASFQAQLTALKTSDSYLFKRGANADAGAGGGGGSAPEAGSSINDMIRGRRG